MISCPHARPCLSGPLQFQSTALPRCVRLDSGPKLSSSLNPHPLQGDVLLPIKEVECISSPLTLGLGTGILEGLHMSHCFKSAYQIRLAPLHLCCLLGEDTAGPREIKNLWSQSAQPTPADLLWAGKAESWRPWGMMSGSVGA